MTQNLISATLTQADFEAIMDAFDLILEKLPFAVELSPEERHALPKQGPKSVEFVSGIKVLANQNPGAIPAVLDLAEFNKDTALCTQLFQLDIKAKQVAERVNDTFLANGSDCFVGSLLLYRVFRALALPGLDTNLDNLGRRFARSAATQNPEPAPTP